MASDMNLSLKHYRKTLILLIPLIFLGGCQTLGQPQQNPQLQSLSEQQERLKLDLQEQLLHLGDQQQQQQQHMAQQLQQLREQLLTQQEESLRIQRQHTFQIEELGRDIHSTPSREPGFTVGRVTEVVQNDGKLLLGQYEWVALPTQQLVLPARVDSGANTSSLHAVNLREFERDGRTWVRFETHYKPESNENIEPQKAEVEAPVVRTVRIIQASGTEMRPVVTLPIRLGPISQNVEFTLSDRGDLTFPVLLGRRFMMDIAVIDVARTYVQGKPQLSNSNTLASVEDPNTTDEEDEEAEDTP